MSGFVSPDPLPGEHTELLDRIVVHDREGTKRAEWDLRPDERMGEPPPFVRHGVEQLGWRISRRVRASGTIALPTLPEPAEDPEKAREG